MTDPAASPAASHAASADASPATSADAAFVDIARSRLCVHLTGQVRACIDALRPEQIWWRPNEKSNAIGNLVLHCTGSTRFYIGRIIGGSDFVRDRRSEFAERRELPAALLRANLDQAIEEADTALRGFDPGRLLEVTEETPEPMTLAEVITLQVSHYALHVGQIAYATKLINADAIHEIWRKTPSR